MKEITLNDGVKIPQIGFGTFLIPNDGTTYRAVRTALDLGYRHIDTAAAYFNEEEVGRAIKDSGIKREEIFVTSKLWLQDYVYSEAIKGTERSLKNLGLDYIDLYLLHQPYGKVEEAWKALEKMKEEGKLRSIGVSNMTPRIWDSFVPSFGSMPSVNQVEMNPFFQQVALREKLKKDNVTIEAYQPLGHGNANLLNSDIVTEIAKAHSKENAAVILNFIAEEGAVVLVKSTKEERIKSNLNIFDFTLTEDEIKALRALDTKKGGHDPETPGMGELLLKNYKVHD